MTYGIQVRNKTDPSGFPGGIVGSGSHLGRTSPGMKKQKRAYLLPDEKTLLARVLQIEALSGIPEEMHAKEARIVFHGGTSISKAEGAPR